RTRPPKTWCSSTRSTRPRDRSLTRPHALNGRAPSSTAAPCPARSSFASRWAPQRLPWFSGGRPTSASSVVRQTSSCPEPERDVGTIRDQDRDARVVQEPSDVHLLVDRPHPGGHLDASAVAQQANAGQALVN